MKISELEEYTDAETNYQGTLLIAREISRILFWEKMKLIAPAVANELMKAGVDFSNAKDIWGEMPEVDYE